MHVGEAAAGRIPEHRPCTVRPQVRTSPLGSRFAWIATAGVGQSNGLPHSPTTATLAGRSKLTTTVVA